MKKTQLVIFFALAALLAGFTVQAQKLGIDCGGPGQNPCGICNLFDLVYNIINIVIKVIVPLIAVLVIVIAGGKMMLNMQNSEIVNQTRGIMLAVVIGLVLVYGGYALVGTILTGMGMNVDPLDWQPKCE